jgi:hypothetical protein
MTDILDQMSKEEVVAWARKNSYFRPSRGDMLYIRWHIRSKKLQERMEANHRFFKTIDLKRRDALAREFNKTDQLSRKEELIKEIIEIDRQVKVWMKEETAIIKSNQRLDSLYKEAARERKKER